MEVAFNGNEKTLNQHVYFNPKAGWMSLFCSARLFDRQNGIAWISQQTNSGLFSTVAAVDGRHLKIVIFLCPHTNTWAKMFNPAWQSSVWKKMWKICYFEKAVRTYTAKHKHTLNYQRALQTSWAVLLLNLAFPFDFLAFFFSFSLCIFSKYQFTERQKESAHLIRLSAFMLSVFILF